MKNKYQRMSKEEKKKLIIEYKNTEKGKYMMQKLRNLIIIGVISYFYAIYLILSSKNKVSRNETKKELLSVAERILIDLKIKVQEVNSEFVLGALLTLKALINDLNRDLEN